MIKIIITSLLLFASVICKLSGFAQPVNINERINILILTERGGHHRNFTDAAFKWLAEEKEGLNIACTGSK